jgi:hypothetical protein
MCISGQCEAVSNTRGAPTSSKVLFLERHPPVQCMWLMLLHLAVLLPHNSQGSTESNKVHCERPAAVAAVRTEACYPLYFA